MIDRWERDIETLRFDNNFLIDFFFISLLFDMLKERPTTGSMICSSLYTVTFNPMKKI
jgi:hypothetical protein